MKELTKKNKISEGVLFPPFYIHGQTISTLGYRPATSPTMQHLIVKPHPSMVGPTKHKVRITESMTHQQRVLDRMKTKSGNQTAYDSGPKTISFFVNLHVKTPKSQISASTQPFPID